MNISKKYKKWKKSYRSRRLYCASDRYPFYDIAAKYLPRDTNAVIVDVGAGQGKFADYLDLSNRYENVYLLDANEATIEDVKKKYQNTILYRAPDPLPFESNSVSYVHCSHILEHLQHQELYRLLKEIDRILGNHGILVISAPILWSKFYDDLSHVRPFNPAVFFSYLCHQSKDRSTYRISHNYAVVDLVYRYTTVDFDEGWGSTIPMLDFIIQVSKRIVSSFGFKRYKKNGFTMVLVKEL